MVSVAFLGHVIEECPLGLARPSSSRAVEVPPSWPANHISRTDLTLSNHGISTGLAVFMTTIVFGLAAATAATSLLLASESWTGADRLVPARSGLVVVETAPTPSLTKTIAAFLPTAAAAAASMSPWTREYAKRKLAGAVPSLLNVIVTAWKDPPVSEPAANVRLVSSGSV